MFRKILIANRGEIACRVIKTARRLGIATVSVYSDADTQSLHRWSADESIRIGPAPASKSYLDPCAVIAACEATGADAVHPGYGFLSENVAFAQSLSERGITFIGPNTHAIAIMGDKIESKKAAEIADVNVVPGFVDVVRDANDAVRVANEIGYPVMLKASAGGGGKGMRVVSDDGECRQGFIQASHEALGGFGDDRLFVEKFIEHPRHIEIQILADQYGNVVSLGERECSIQRRHQKIIEEAPSPFIDEQIRERMSSQAIQLAKSVNYVSAGTVEFIVDKQRNFYFLEMNTRLQVEHPVTEFITRIDLVEEMIRVSAGEALSFEQSDIGINGHSIECRLYAEDPSRDFLPSTGRVNSYLVPEENEVVRIDSGIKEGSDISIYYDPMLAKAISFGASRDDAIDNMLSVLDRCYIEGVVHNVRFLSALLSHQRFRDGDLTTTLIAEEYPDGFTNGPIDNVDIELLVAVAAYAHVKTEGRINGLAPQRTIKKVAVLSDRQIPLKLMAEPEGYLVSIGDKDLLIESQWCVGDILFFAVVGGHSVCIQIQRIINGYRITHSGCQIDVHLYAPRVAELSQYMVEKESPDLSAFLLSPMPGLLVSINVKVGQKVKATEELVVVEAMKMENTLRADRDVVVDEILVEAGDSVTVNQPLLLFRRE